MDETKQAREEIVEYINAFLGGSMVDVELSPSDYTIAIDKALSKYRQRSSNAVEESMGFLTLTTDVNEYQMPKEVMSIRQLFRRSIGSRTGGGNGGSLFEPFNLAYSNTYLLASTNMGGLATYYSFASYQKQVGKMFGSDINFSWNAATKKLTIMQRPRGEESVLLWLYNTKPDFALLDDPYAGIWLKDYALAQCKVILGEARSKFAQIASPQGGTQLNGDALKAEGKEALDKMELELATYSTGEKPMWFVVG